jgi:hypothetical protein
MSPSPIGGSGGGGFDRYNIQPKKRKKQLMALKAQRLLCQE